MLNSVSFLHRVQTGKYKTDGQSAFPKAAEYNAPKKNNYTNAIVNFKQLYSEYEKPVLLCVFENSDEKSYLKFILSLDESDDPKEIKKFLYSLTASKERFEKFAEELFEKPKNLNKITRLLIDKIGGKEEFFDWLNNPVCGYKKAYGEYYKHKFENSTPEELIKFSPNMNFNYLKRTHGDFKLGDLQSKITMTCNEYEKLIQTLEENCGNRLDAPLRFKIGANEIVKHGGKNGSVKSINFLNINGEDYVMKIDHPVSGKNWRSTTAYLPDSTFQNAAVDFYLKSNGVKGVADIIFYDSKNQSALYKCTYGDFVGRPQNLSREEYNKKYLKEINNLGIYMNDINPGNFIRDCHTNEAILIDSGHCTYANPLKPDLPYYNMNFTNVCGSDFIKDKGALEFILEN